MPAADVALLISLQRERRSLAAFGNSGDSAGEPQPKCAKRLERPACWRCRKACGGSKAEASSTLQTLRVRVHPQEPSQFASMLEHGSACRSCEWPRGITLIACHLTNERNQGVAPSPPQLAGLWLAWKICFGKAA